MTAAAGRRSAWVLAGLLLTFAALAPVAAVPLIVPRLGLTILALATVVLVARRSPGLAVWAPLPLGLLALGAYALLPWAAYPLAMAQFHSYATEAYVGSLADRVVLAAGAVILAAVAAAAAVPVPAPAPFIGRRGLAAGTVVLAGVVWAAVGLAAGPSWAAMAAPPFCALAAALLVDGFARGTRAGLAALATVIAGAALPFLALSAFKPAAFVLAGAALLWGCTRWVAPRALLAGLGVAAAALVVVLAAAPQLRGIQNNLGPLQSFLGKAYFRQAEVGRCLLGVLEAEPGTGSPVYFAAGLVPRAVWPDKPSLSNGADYGRRFCGAGEAGHHSASVSLVGEPLAEAGVAGLLAAGSVFALLHVSLLAAVRRGGGTAAAAALGLLPWLADFDQHFAMYLANAVKMGFLAVPAWAVIHFWWRKPVA